MSYPRTVDKLIICCSSYFASFYSISVWLIQSQIYHIKHTERYFTVNHVCIVNDDPKLRPECPLVDERHPQLTPHLMVVSVKVQHARSQHHTGISFVPSFLSVLTRQVPFLSPTRKVQGVTCLLWVNPWFYRRFSSKQQCKIQDVLGIFPLLWELFFNSMKKVQRIFMCSFVIFVEGKEILVYSNRAFCCVSPVNKHEGGRFIVLICRRLSSVPVCSSATNFSMLCFFCEDLAWNNAPQDIFCFQRLVLKKWWDAFSVISLKEKKNLSHQENLHFRLPVPWCSLWVEMD